MRTIRKYEELWIMNVCKHDIFVSIVWLIILVDRLLLLNAQNENIEKRDAVMLINLTYKQCKKVHWLTNLSISAVANHV